MAFSPLKTFYVDRKVKKMVSQWDRKREESWKNFKKTHWESLKAVKAVKWGNPGDHRTKYPLVFDTVDELAKKVNVKLLGERKLDVENLLKNLKSQRAMYKDSLGEAMAIAFEKAYYKDIKAFEDWSTSLQQLILTLAKATSWDTPKLSLVLKRLTWVEVSLSKRLEPLAMLSLSKVKLKANTHKHEMRLASHLSL